MNFRKLLFILVVLAIGVPAFAQVATQRITLTIVVTNRAVTSNTLVVNSSTRTWTNISTAATIPTNLVSTATTATNLYNQIANFPYSGGISPRWLTETSMALIAPLGGALAASQSGAWAVLTLSTQSGPNTFTAYWPLENIAGPAVNKTNQASAFVSGLSDFSTNAFATNATAINNTVQKGAGPRQYVLSEVEYLSLLLARYAQLTNANLVNATNRGYVVAITNGYWTNGIADRLTVTNLSSPGTGLYSEKFGSNSIASGDYSFSGGYSASATADSATAWGPLAVASGAQSSAFGNLAQATAVGATAVGSEDTRAFGPYSLAGAQGAIATKWGGMALGFSAVNDYSNSVALGPPDHLGNATVASATNQIRLGTANHTVSVPGVLAVSGTQTDTIFSGTNKFQLAISYSVTNITSLANGGNDLDPGFKTYIKVSGPSAAYSIDKIDRGWDGRIIEIQKTDSLTLTIPNNSGFGVLGDSAKILTGTGGTITITNNPGFVELKYDAGALRWGVKSKSN